MPTSAAAAKSAPSPRNCPAATMAVPGEKPDSPQPSPKIRLPATSRASRAGDSTGTDGPGSTARPMRRCRRMPAKATKIAARIARPKPGSQPAPGRRKACTCAGSAMPEMIRPTQQSSPQANAASRIMMAPSRQEPSQPQRPQAARPREGRPPPPATALTDAPVRGSLDRLGRYHRGARQSLQTGRPEGPAAGCLGPPPASGSGAQNSQIVGARTIPARTAMLVAASPSFPPSRLPSMPDRFMARPVSTRRRAAARPTTPPPIRAAPCPD